MNLDQTRPGRKPQDQAKQWNGSNMDASTVSVDEGPTWRLSENWLVTTMTLFGIPCRKVKIMLSYD